MRAGTDAPVRTALKEAVLRLAPAAAITEVRAGDTALIAADDSVALAHGATPHR
jgi:hypothetical protein